AVRGVGQALEGGIEGERQVVAGAGDGAAQRGVDGRHAIIGRVPSPILAHNAFVRATLTNFFFSLSLNGYVLLPLHVHALGATAVAPLLGEWIVRHVGFRMLFVISALLGAVPLVLVLRLGGPRRAKATAPAPGWILAGLADVLQRHMVVSLFFGLGSGTIFAFLPTFAQSLAVTTLSLFYTAYAGAAIAVRVFGGRLIDTRGRRAVIVPSMFLQASAPALLAIIGILVTRTSTTPVVPVLFLAGLLSGGAHGFLYPGLAALVTDLARPARRATAVGVFSAM